MKKKHTPTFSFLPVRKVSIRTRLSEAEAFRRLQAALLRPDQYAKRYPRPTEEDQVFIGEVAPPHFHIHQVVGYRENSFIPLLIGTVQREGEGTLITVRMRLNGCVLALVLVWSYVPLMLLFLSLFFGIRDRTLEPSVPLAALGFLTFGFVIMTFGFRRGEKAARLFLSKTFEGEML